MKKGKVICKFILVILLLLSMLPIFVTNTAVAVDLEGQDNTTQSDKVKFKAYFTSSTGTETHSMVADINGQRPEINYQINVEEGRLENPVIKGLRNRIVHDYEGIKLNLIWDIVTNDIIELKENLKRIIELTQNK